MKIDKRDFQTLSLFAILLALTLFFVMGSRLVLFAPLREQAKLDSAPGTEGTIDLHDTLDPDEAKVGPFSR